MAIPESKIMLAVYLATPEVENDRRAMNTRAGMRRAMREWRWMGAAVKGYRNTINEQHMKIIVPDENVKFIIEAFEELAKGIYTQEEVRKQLYDKGFKCSRNNFNVLLRNPVYCGLIKVRSFKDEEEQIVKGIHQPLISVETFWKVQEVIAGRKPKKPEKNTKRDELPLRGFLLCAKCGQPMTGSASRGRHGKRYFYYHCQPHCAARHKAEVLNNALVDELKRLQSNEEIIDLYYEVMRDIFKKNGTDKTKEIKRVSDEFQKIQARQAKAQELMLDGGIDASDYREIKKRNEEEMNRLNREKNNLEFVDDDFEAYLDFARTLLKNLVECCEVADITAKQLLVGSIFSEKLIFENNQYRTPKLNEAVELMCLGDKELRGIKRGSNGFQTFQSPRVARRGIEPLLPE